MPGRHVVFYSEWWITIRWSLFLYFLKRSLGVSRIFKYVINASILRTAKHQKEKNTLDQSISPNYASISHCLNLPPYTPLASIAALDTSLIAPESDTTDLTRPAGFTGAPTAPSPCCSLSTPWFSIWFWCFLRRHSSYSCRCFVDELRMMIWSEAGWFEIGESNTRGICICSYLTWQHRAPSAAARGRSSGHVGKILVQARLTAEACLLSKWQPAIWSRLARKCQAKSLPQIHSLAYGSDTLFDLGSERQDFASLFQAHPIKCASLPLLVEVNSDVNVNATVDWFQMRHRSWLMHIKRPDFTGNHHSFIINIVKLYRL